MTVLRTWQLPDSTWVEEHDTGQVVVVDSPLACELETQDRVSELLTDLREGTASLSEVVELACGLAGLQVGMADEPPEIPPMPSGMAGPAGPRGDPGESGSPGQAGGQGPPGVPGTTSWNGITDKPSAFTPSSHSHPESDVTGLTTALSGKSAASHTHADLPSPGQKNALAGTSGTPGSGNEFVTTQDARNTNARTPLSHAHPESEITNLVADLAAKAPTAHTHTASQVTDFNATGDARWAPAGGGGFSWTAIPRQAADSTQATAAFKVSDLTFPFVANGVYAVELFLIMRSSLATAGFRLALDTSVAVTTVALNFAHVLANAGTVTSGQSRADATATGLTSGVDLVNADIPVFGHGILVAAANAGTATLVFGPEITATATMKANSVMRVHKVA